MAVVTTKSYILPDGRASIVRPECELQKFVSTKSFSRRVYQVKTKCKCGCQFNVQFEFRKQYRKEVNLTGVCKVANNGILAVRIFDLSLGGVCLEVQKGHKVSSGDKGIIKFTLDDRKKNEVMKKFTVRSTSASIIHCEFIKDKEYEQELGFYLRF